jgi:hypothetical protein
MNRYRPVKNNFVWKPTGVMSPEELKSRNLAGLATVAAYIPLPEDHDDDCWFMVDTPVDTLKLEGLGLSEDTLIQEAAEVAPPKKAKKKIFSNLKKSWAKLFKPKDPKPPAPVIIEPSKRPGFLRRLWRKLKSN